MDATVAVLVCGLARVVEGAVAPAMAVAIVGNATAEHVPHITGQIALTTKGMAEPSTLIMSAVSQSDCAKCTQSAGSWCSHGGACGSTAVLVLVSAVVVVVGAVVVSGLCVVGAAVGTTTAEHVPHITGQIALTTAGMPEPSTWTMSAVSQPEFAKYTQSAGSWCPHEAGLLFVLVVVVLAAGLVEVAAVSPADTAEVEVPCKPATRLATLFLIVSASACVTGNSVVTMEPR